MKEFILFLSLSLFVHGVIFFGIGKQNPLHLAFQRGETLVEIVGFPASNGSRAARVVKPLASPLFGNARDNIPIERGSESVGTSANPPASPSGISDGSELGIPKPRYPLLSRLRGEEGSVLLNLRLAARNCLVDVELSQSAGFAELDRSALSTVKNALPGCEGSASIQEVRVLFHFRIE